MKLKINYIDKESEIRYSCIANNEIILNKEDKERIKRKIIKSTGKKNIEIIKWKRL